MKKLHIVTLWMATLFFGLNGFAQKSALPLLTPKTQKTVSKLADEQPCKFGDDCQSGLCAFYTKLGEDQKTLFVPMNSSCIPRGTRECPKLIPDQGRYSCWFTYNRGNIS